MIKFEITSGEIKTKAGEIAKCDVVEVYDESDTLVGVIYPREHGVVVFSMCKPPLSIEHSDAALEDTQ